MSHTATSSRHLPTYHIVASPTDIHRFVASRCIVTSHTDTHRYVACRYIVTLIPATSLRRYRLHRYVASPADTNGRRRQQSNPCSLKCEFMFNFYISMYQLMCIKLKRCTVTLGATTHHVASLQLLNNTTRPLLLLQRTTQYLAHLQHTINNYGGASVWVHPLCCLQEDF